MCKATSSHFLRTSAEKRRKRTEGLTVRRIRRLLLNQEEKELAMRPILPWHFPFHLRCAQTHTIHRIQVGQTPSQIGFSHKLRRKPTAAIGASTFSKVLGPRPPILIFHTHFRILSCFFPGCCLHAWDRGIFLLHPWLPSFSRGLLPHILLRMRFSTRFFNTVDDSFDADDVCSTGRLFLIPSIPAGIAHDILPWKLLLALKAPPSPALLLAASSSATFSYSMSVRRHIFTSPSFLRAGLELHPRGRAWYSTPSPDLTLVRLLLSSPWKLFLLPPISPSRHLARMIRARSFLYRELFLVIALYFVSSWTNVNPTSTFLVMSDTFHVPARLESFFSDNDSTLMFRPNLLLWRSLALLRWLTPCRDYPAKMPTVAHTRSQLQIQTDLTTLCLCLLFSSFRTRSVRPPVLNCCLSCDECCTESTHDDVTDWRRTNYLQLDKKHADLLRTKSTVTEIRFHFKWSQTDFKCFFDAYSAQTRSISSLRHVVVSLLITDRVDSIFPISVF